MPHHAIVLVRDIPAPANLLTSGFYLYSYGGKHPSPFVDLGQAQVNAICAGAHVKDQLAAVRWHLDAAKQERINPKGMNPAQSRRIHACHIARMLWAHKRLVRVVNERAAWRRAVVMLTERQAKLDQAAEPPPSPPVSIVADMFRTGAIFGLPAARVRA